jgi:HlyD family secretion protein
VWVGLPVARIPDLDTMGVTAKLSDVDDGKVTPGEPVICTLDAYPDRTFPGRIAEIMPVAQEDGNRSLRRAYTVRIRLDASDPDRMRPGMSVKVEADGPPQEGVLLAPRAGFDLSADSPRARLASGREIPVKLGDCGDTSCIVLDGLREGDRLQVTP